MTTLRLTHRIMFCLLFIIHDMNCFTIHCTLDLAPSDYYLFLLLKKYLKARRYEGHSALGSSIHQCLDSLSKDDFTAAIQQLPERWRKCISVNGRHFEKEHIYD